MLRSAVESNGGYLVKSTGDGIHAAFDSAHAGVLAAVDAQRALVAHTWSEATGPLRVRMGLHSGEAELRDGDYFGPAVNRAARVMAVAHAGQILCSGATAGLVEDEPLPGVELLDLGEHRLRDIARPDRLFQVCAAGLPREFPPLATVDAAPGNLPPSAQLVRRARGRRRGHRCCARRRPARHADGRRRCRQDAAGARGRRAASIHSSRTARGGASSHRRATATRSPRWSRARSASPAQPGLSLEASILELLRTRDALLVLDNCEHLLDEAGRFATTILLECRSVRHPRDQPGSARRRRRARLAVAITRCARPRLRPRRGGRF